MKKLHPAMIALTQALATAVYVAAISGLLFLIGRSNLPVHELLTGIIVLMLLVFSAGVCALIIFGYPLYFLINKKTKIALEIIGYTFLFLFVSIFIFSVLSALYYLI
ncbi:MAG: hypothetical protein ACOZBH_05150 [Patescibacteria group bacterium]